MNREELFEALGQVDETFLELADTYQPRKNRFVMAKGLTAAACLVLTIGGISLVSGLQEEPSREREAIHLDEGEGTGENSVSSPQNEDLAKEGIGQQITGGEGQGPGGEAPVPGGANKVSFAGDNEAEKEQSREATEEQSKEAANVENDRPENLMKEEATKESMSVSSSNQDMPVSGEPSETGALTPYEAVWGGSFLDENGHWVVWLTENTPENQRLVFERNPSLSEATTTFRTADFSLAYLTGLLADISEGMGNGKLPFVSTAAVMEQSNRVEVRMTTDDADKVAKILSFDSIGGAIEIKYSVGDQVKNQIERKDPKKD
ncbi:MAG: hypothetical protein ACI4FY_00470 [Acetatifactor sp.]